MLKAALCFGAGLTLPAVGWAQDREDVFDLGEIIVVGKREAGERVYSVGGAVLEREDLWTFERQSLEQAVNLVPGVSSTLDSNGRRNESDIFVRGFGRWHVPLLIDGVRVYLPADNRLDFGRFLTADVAEVQIQKGYASVIDGPGAMGGLINLVTRKPTQPFEAEARAGASYDSDGEFQGWDSYLMAGTRQDNFYAQASINFLDRDFWTLSEDYQPTATSLEDGGERLSSDTRDWRANVKFGFTPNATDEYTLNYTRQEGEKGAPINVYNNPPVPPNSFWRWPWWNIDNLSLLTHTQLGDDSYVRFKLYRNTFDNALYAYDTIAYTTQAANGRFRSMYEDHAYGGSMEFGTELNAANTLKVAAHYRNDNHDEWQILRPDSPPNASTEPKQRQSQDTWSLAVENTWRATDDFDLIAGASYEKYWVNKAQEWNSTTRTIFEYPKGGSDAFNWQLAGIWRYSATAQWHASVSDRARFPTIFELYSTRFGTAVPNPNLGPERATNFEVGWQGEVGNTSLSGAVFYSDVQDLIQTVQIAAGQTQTQNVGDGEYYGIELSLETRLTPQLVAGANYTHMNRSITDSLQPNLQATGVPDNKSFIYMTWSALGNRFSITPSVDIAGDRWSDVSTNPVRAFPYTRTGSVALTNVQAEYEVLPNVDVSAGVRNLFDEDYELSWGLPMQGRTFYLKTRLNF